MLCKKEMLPREPCLFPLPDKQIIPRLPNSLRHPHPHPHPSPLLPRLLFSLLLLSPPPRPHMVMMVVAAVDHHMMMMVGERKRW